MLSPGFFQKYTTCTCLLTPSAAPQSPPHFILILLFCRSTKVCGITEICGIIITKATHFCVNIIVKVTLHTNFVIRRYTMYKLLIVDDEQKIREVIREYAEFNGFAADEAADGMSAIGLVKLNDYDLIIMDVMMPKLDGFSACKEIKKLKDIPIIMLSARGEEYDKLFGFELGIDDYVVKPFSPKELIARVNAVISRNKASAPADSDELSFGGLVINMPARTVTIDGEKAELTPKEYELLFYLVKNRNLALSRDKLLQDIWGYDFFGDDRTIDTHIKNLRNNLGPYRDYIVTLRGVGYKFEAGN